MASQETREAPRCALPGSSYRTAAIAAVAVGTPVVSSDGVEIGAVEATLDNYGEHVFNGITFTGRDGVLHFTEAYEVRRAEQEITVVLGVTAEEAQRLPTPAEAFEQMGSSGKELANEFAHAIAAKDFERVKSLLHPEVDFKAVTPVQSWEASDAAGVVTEILPNWFWDTDELENELLGMEIASFADRTRVGFRLRGHNPTDGTFMFEQQAYLAERDGRIGWMRLTCSGYRPIGSSDLIAAGER
jgi:hypothetical protein